MWLVQHTNQMAGKPELQPETDISSKLPVTSFDVTHHGLAELSKLICSTKDFTSQLQRDRDWVSERLLKKLFIKFAFYCTDLDLFLSALHW